MTAKPTDSAAERVVIGKITSVYGIKGWVKIHSYTEPMENFLSYTDCQIQRGGLWQPISFEEGKRHGKGLVARIAGVDDRDLAAQYCKCEVAIAADALPALAEDEFYWHQLEGLRVYTQNDKGEELLLGKVSHLLETGANDVLVVRKCAGSIDREERLIPYLPGQFITDIDIANGLLRVDWDPEF
ncbi:ribosome maturation factor RimM [Dasania sp. GY-MA-18]|uniref:Ribosome maturation factor RimM n=1 Tax=Dasania phycosphaerae TaxID=2950436 RepID=A0A9J6RLD3_9GAMM|nr:MULTISPECIES: ribosome maturation factor RimM [Dasania]MCR8922707.1 ribosome maturation factor RimM [Dasania sp. GY-MA-18]MCZ0865137.1 ribosome maturation factor RimM [Dasania phycosphaerae]MCZ0868863.1 ribosome maturation factor RimM [Dasania phycosphaerae]